MDLSDIADISGYADITETFENIINQHHALDDAEGDFRRLLVDDPGLKRLYRDWCEEQGLSERRGFATYFRERCDQEAERWQPLDGEQDD